MFIKKSSKLVLSAVALAFVGLSNVAPAEAREDLWVIAAIPTVEAVVGDFPGGVGIDESLDSARKIALKNCRKSSSSCRISFEYWDGGCGFMATGHSNSKDSSTSAAGRDANEALNKCRATYAGNTCTVVVDKCTKKP